MQTLNASRYSVVLAALDSISRVGHDGTRRHEAAKRGSRMFCVRPGLESVVPPRNRLTTGAPIYWQRHSDYRVSGVANAGNVDAWTQYRVASVVSRMLSLCNAARRVLSVER
jgi:hypothetical protein